MKEKELKAQARAERMKKFDEERAAIESGAAVAVRLVLDRKLYEFLWYNNKTGAPVQEVINFVLKDYMESCEESNDIEGITKELDEKLKCGACARVGTNMGPMAHAPGCLYADGTAGSFPPPGRVTPTGGWTVADKQLHTAEETLEVLKDIRFGISALRETSAGSLHMLQKLLDNDNKFAAEMEKRRVKHG